MNVGASAPEESGLYFSWGNSPGQTEGSGYDFSQEVYNKTPGNAIVANLTLAEDMARQSMGTPWRMPTAAEFLELFNNCTSVWTTKNGVAGRLFTSKVNGNSIFFPAAGIYDGTSLYTRGSHGFYWSSSYKSATNAEILDFDNSSVSPRNSYYRRSGITVRAVRG